MRLGDAEKRDVREQAAAAVESAVALLRKADALEKECKREEAVAVCDEVIARFGDAPEPEVLQYVAAALDKKASTIYPEREEETMALYDEVVRRFGDAVELEARRSVARSLMGKGGRLFYGRDTSEEAVRVFDDVVARFGGAPEAEFKEHAARALLHKAFLLKLRGQSEQYDLKRQGKQGEAAPGYVEALAAIEEVLSRFGGAQELELCRLVAAAFLQKANLLSRQGKWEEGVAVCNEVVRRFADAADRELRESVASAFLVSAAFLLRMWREKGKGELLLSAVDSARRGVALGSSHYYLACALALSGHTDEALDELEWCLGKERKRWRDVDGSPDDGIEPDPDWDGLRDHPRYLALKAEYEWADED